MNIKMYRIREEGVRIQVPCEKCMEKGIIDKTCYKCGGKGLHNKTVGVWEVCSGAVSIGKIDRSKTTGDLRYWIDDMCYYLDNDGIMHFTKKDAQYECDKRNEDVLSILEIHERNKN